MVHLRFSIDLSYEVIGQPADFIFNIHAAQTAHQFVQKESLTSAIYYDPTLRHRLLRLRANPGPQKIAIGRKSISGLLWLIVAAWRTRSGWSFALYSRLRYGHFIWYLFVMAGTVCHYFAVLWYAA